MKKLLFLNNDILIYINNFNIIDCICLHCNKKVKKCFDLHININYLYNESVEHLDKCKTYILGGK